MKKIVVFLVTALLCLLSLSGLAADLLLVAQVTAREEVSLLAPYSGEVAPFTLKAGDMVQQGEVALTILPREAYAEIAGTLVAVHAGPGQSASAASQRYGGVMQIMPLDRFELHCSMRGGYNSKEYRDLQAGTRVYIKSSDGKHTAEGEILSVQGLSFTVSVMGGDLQFDEEARVYRSEDYADKSLLGKAKPTVVQPYKVQGAGTVLQVAAQKGARVAEGDLLYTYAPEALSQQQVKDKGRIAAEKDMVISALQVSPGARVSQGQVLATACPTDALWLTAKAQEGDLAKLAPGTRGTISFEELNLPPLPVTVESVAQLGTGEETALFQVYLSFDAPENVLLGMHGTIRVE